MAASPNRGYMVECSRNTLGNGSSRETTSFTFKLENLDS